MVKAINKSLLPVFLKSLTDVAILTIECNRLEATPEDWAENLTATPDEYLNNPCFQYRNAKRRTSNSVKEFEQQTDRRDS